MLIGITIAGLLVALWLVAALVPVVRHGISFQQGLLYAPLKLIYGIDDRQIAQARKCKTPVIYVVLHRSRLDPALMLTLLPDTTLHILDGRSATAGWLEPYRSLAPTIAFNAEHLFVSRRLVRRLKGGGRLAVYMPDLVEPDPIGFRLYRAIVRIASQADARIVPIDITGARHLPFSNTPPDRARRRWFPCLSIRTLEGYTTAELVARAGENRTMRAHALFDRMAELRIVSANPDRSLFRSLVAAARQHGPGRIALEGPRAGPKSYRRLFAEARLVGRHVQGKTLGASEPVGLLMPNSAHMATAFLGLQSAGRPAALIDPVQPTVTISAFLRTAGVRVLVTSRELLEETGLQELADLLQDSGLRLIHVEDILAEAGMLSRLGAFLFWRFALNRRAPDEPALVIAGRMEEGQSEALVFSQRNVISNVLQLLTRIDLSPADRILNFLPSHHCAGLMGGTLLALMSGARLLIARPNGTSNPAAWAKPTILLASGAELERLSQGGLDRSQLRAVYTGTLPVPQEARAAIRERLGAGIFEAYAVGEAAPIVAINSTTHSREGSVGRLLPGIRMRLDAVEGVEGAARLWLQGPGLARWLMREDRPGRLQPLGEWLDTGDLVSVDREGFLTIRGKAQPQSDAGSLEQPAA